ncbi:protein TOPAZ1 isoform X1 [Takifugu rubripes]|nr:protein TOPAZ1 isoform X1 [Takifugu rubripes]
MKGKAVKKGGFDRSTGSRGSGGKSMRRVTSTGSHCKHASPQRNTSGRQGRKPGNHQAEKPEFVVEFKKKNRVPKASRKIIVSIDQYPAVTLCDISQTFDAFSQDCSYVLPDVLKAKVVRCFKREMRAEFHFEPGQFRRDRSRNEDSALAGSQHICTPDPSQGLTPDHQTPLRARPLVLSGGSADPPFNSLTGCKCAWNGAASKDPGLKGAESLSNRNKSIARRSKHVPGSSRTPSSVEENGVIGEFCNRMCTPTHSGTSPGVVCQNIEDTCQRARAYFRKTSSSCARTDMPWPLPNSGLTHASHTATPACPAPPADPTDTVDSPIRTNDQDAQSGYPSETLLGAPEGSSSGPAQCIYHKKDESRDGENGELVRNVSSRSPDSTNVGFAPNSLQAETQPSPTLDGHGRESSDDVNSPLHTDHQCDHSRTPPCPSAVLLSDTERTSSSYPISPPSSFQPGEVRSVSLVGLSPPCSITGPLENHLFFSKDARMDSFYSSSSESSLLLPQYKRDCDEEPLSGLPKLLPYYERSISDDDNYTVYSLLYDACRETDNALPPILSPVTSPHRPSWSPGSSYRMEPEEDTYSHEPPQLVNDKGIPGVDRGSGDVLNPALPTKPQFSPSTHHGAKRSSPSTGASDNGDQTCAGALDEVTAYKQDILLVDVTQDDAELFENLPQTSLLKLGPVRVSEELKFKPVRTAKKQQPNSDRLQVELGHRATPVITDYSCDSADDAEESNKRPWRPQSSSVTRHSTWPLIETQRELTSFPDSNNNHANKSSERSHPTKPLNPLHSHNTAALSTLNGPCGSNSPNLSELRRQKSNSYCWKYFGESTTCGFKPCRFLHLPLEGDEKFCSETILRFTKNPMCLHKARAVFTGYYLSNAPGAFFSMPVLLSLLWALLKAGMVSDVFAVLNVSVCYKIVPGHEFVLALFNFVREKGHTGLIPELMQLTFKMAAAGLVLSFDWLDGLKNNSEVQPPICATSKSDKGTVSVPCLGYLNVAHTVVEIELCTKLEDWRRMGDVFSSVCQSIQRPNQLEQISGHIAIALLSESKDKQAVPFSAFAETVYQKEQDSLTMTYLGRIGVSLMLRYHKTHQWAKGRRVAEFLSFSKINYSTLKGLFGNEDGASRCFLVTVATELFLLSGSIEGALNTLRENSWFLSSSVWPCDAADVESRTRVLLRLGERTSHRGTLEVLSHLPGLKEPNDFADVSNYCSVFNAHLQVCVDRQTLPVASDLVDFMLSKQLAVEPALLQALLQKLGRQNLWLRAREVFRHSLSQGYYQGVSAPPGFMALLVPCQLGEVELALAFEMFITVNGSIILQAAENDTGSLNITLKRTRSGESEYLSAGSRVLTAASVPQPKLSIQYTAVNSSQEQVFTLDVSSARSWLHHNHLWANEVWAH